MKIHKLSSTDAFIAFDLDDAPATGITRSARKVLQDGAKLLARSTTYSFASFGVQMGGGSAGINADDDARDEAVAAFVDEVTPMVSEGRWRTDPGLGVTENALAALRSVDPRPAALWSEGLAADLGAAGAFAAADALRGSMTGTRIAVVGAGPVVDRLRASATDCEIVGDDVAADADVLFVAGKAGIIDHEVAPLVRAEVIVPLTPVPVTARAHAMLTAAGRVHVPDFLTTAAPLLHGVADLVPDGDDPAARIRRRVGELAEHGAGLWMAAAVAAEDFLGTWQTELPSFRPLA